MSKQELVPKLENKNIEIHQNQKYKLSIRLPGVAVEYITDLHVHGPIRAD
jgi:hypothetical protein